MAKIPFTPAWWLPNGHLQTIWQTLVRRNENLTARYERIELPDGDFLDLAWVGPDKGPIVIVLHGIAGSIDSPYAQGILQTIVKSNWRGLFVHFRGCSGVPNRLPRFYHSGETEDIDYIIKELQRREPSTPIAVIGFSLGGNVLIKWLSKNTNSNLIIASVAVSVPFELYKAADHLNQGLSRFYQWYLLRSLRNLIKTKFSIKPGPISLEEIDKLRTFWEFDNKITAPLHGFLDANDYYHQASSRSDLKKITIPTLILQARDDPFIPPEVNPHPHELSPSITFELHETGGHVGFISGKFPWQPVYWLEHRICEYLKIHFKK